MDDRAFPVEGEFDEPTLFEETELYRQVNSDAHKDIPVRVACPCLTWHMAFLIPRKSADDRIDNRDRFKLILDRILVRLVRGLRAANRSVGIEPTAGNHILFKRCVDSDLIRVRRRDCTARQLAVLDADQRLIELEFAWETATITVRVHMQVNLFTITALARLGADASDTDEGTRSRGVDIEEFQDELTLGFWMRFTQFLFSLPRMAQLFRHHIFAHVFADLRGVIVSDESIDLPRVLPLEHGKLDVWASDVVARMSPYVNFADRFECSASYLLHRRAVFMTALGPQPANLPPSKRLPTTFLLCLAPQSQVGVKQLGRVIDRINACETMRLAALLDLGLLRTAGDNLSLVDGAVQAARKAIDDIEQQAGDLVSTQAAVAEAQRVVDAIAKTFLDRNPARAGLTFRIESARYYVSQFRKGVAAMRLGRVEGFQRYDLFVERRLGPTFEYVDRLGTRYDRALQAMRSVNQRYLSTTIAAMNRLSADTGSRVERIQRDGAAIVIGALVPYYLMGAFHYYKNFSFLEKTLFFVIILNLWSRAIHEFEFMHVWREADRLEAQHFEYRLGIVLALILFFISFIPPEPRLDGVDRAVPASQIQSVETGGHGKAEGQAK